MSIGSHSIFKRASGSSKRFLCTSQDGSKVVIYQDSSIRWCNAFDSKYEFMLLEPTIEDVEHVVLSPTGTLLLLYNSREVRIVEIPWGYSQVSYEGFQKFRYSVDSRQDPLIKKVLFHPLAYREHCIVILKTDNTIHLLDRYYPYDKQPKLLVLNQHDGAFGMEGLVTDIESITFSQDGLTLYALSVAEGCDIYAFYPCLPCSIEIDSHKLDLLMHKSLVQYENLSVETPDATKRNTIKQFQFISKLRQGLENDQTKIDIPMDWLRVRGQGPFTIAPFPDRYYDRTAVQLKILPIGANNDLLLMSFDDGTIVVLYQDLELTMCWDSKGYSYNNSLVLVESIRLERGELVLKQGTLSQFFVLGGTSDIYLVDTSPWSKILSNCIDNSDLEPIADLQFKSEISKIEGVSQIDSYAMWKKDTEPKDVFVSKDTVFVKSTAVNDQPSTVKDEKKANVDIPRYEVALNQPMSEILSLNASFQTEAKKPLSKLVEPSKRQTKLNNESNEEQLEILTTVSKEFLQKIVKAQALGFNLHNRCLEQQYELTRQLQYSSEILSKQDKLRSKAQSQSSECESKIQRQDKLLQRFNSLSEKLGRINESPKFREMNITDKEMAWFKEIRNQVLVFNQYVHHQKNQQDQLRYLQKELENISLEDKDVGEKSKSEWTELLSILESDTKIIKECNNQLAHASSEVGFST
ncbi:hypothetical protein ZYGR_0AD06350 [Zygosaccharomyces rouxii]|uniref:ZYRO0G20680p n=2 Tax=Zygosaccharomyces rouxii TaxID=4956 RepID=C5E1G0_ZYGRC|nr:uncharacterized protein ZYRO0G20680g [Zygosaccharomyces rouxii]KAH9202935.1 hypothetical protein LQ764DRAFT_72732 [Zygosaccharomyces rouxii]GAV51452.1 hypothetical protein ZYGR_0AD06350 [Zygosaccharomyces rouxii]CAR29944.1 ZYRO0G20680p [Zygosaccharomyces rouxii]